MEIKVTGQLVTIGPERPATIDGSADQRVVVRLHIQEGELIYTEDYDNPLVGLERIGRERLLAKAMLWGYEGIAFGGALAAGIILGSIWEARYIDLNSAVYSALSIGAYVGFRRAAHYASMGVEVSRQKKEAISRYIGNF